jgi:hypothetical protein
MADPFFAMNERTSLIGARREAVIRQAERMVDDGMSEDGWRRLASAVISLRDLSAKPSIQALQVAAQTPLEYRLAKMLAKIVDATLITVADPDGVGREIELRFACFNREIGEEAAELLEEAGV